MAFDLRSFAAQVRPSPRRPSPEPFAASIFDAGSPQYVRPEDLFLDIQGSLFELERKGSQDLNGTDPSDFRTRWLADAAASLSLQRVGHVTNQQLVEVTMSLLRCSQRKKERHPTLLPILPALGLYKNIKPNLPKFLNDQLRPALTFADEAGFPARVAALRQRLAVGTQQDDSVKQLAAALLPLQPGTNLDPAAQPVAPHDGPLLKDFTQTPSRPLPVCRSLQEALDSLLDLEQRMPRILWTRWLTATLRLWLPLFFLKRCAVTAQGALAAKAVLSSNIVPACPELTTTLFGTNGILRGSSEWLNQLAPLVQNYVRARLEISILLELDNLHEWLAIQGIDPENPAHIARVKRKLDDHEVDPNRLTSSTLPSATGLLATGKISMPGEAGTGRLPFDVWLTSLAANRAALDALAKAIGADDTASLVERVYAFLRPDYEPLRAGFGKNAYEYVAFALGAPRKVDRDPEFPDEFNLIYRGEGGRRSRQIMVQPGPSLLALLVQIVSHQAQRQHQSAAKLSDLLDIFDSLGIDFRSNPRDFETLKADLLKLGLLQSSADAAEAASLKPSYSLS
jgi:hypothetical protein